MSASERRLNENSDISVSEKTEEVFLYHCQQQDWDRILISLSARRLRKNSDIRVSENFEEES
jgi:hypothetical protein